MYVEHKYRARIPVSTIRAADALNNSGTYYIAVRTRCNYSIQIGRICQVIGACNIMRSTYIR